MPSTARQIREAARHEVLGEMLTDPEANIRIGHGLSGGQDPRVRRPAPRAGQLQRGRAAVHRWLGERPGLSKDEFIDDIPYPGDAELREEDSRHRRGLSPHLRGGVGGVSDDDEIPVASPARAGVRRGAAARREEVAGAEGRPAPAQAGSQTPRRCLTPSMSKLTGSKKAPAVHRVGHPRDDAARPSSTAASICRRAFPTSRRRRRSRRRRARRSTRDVNQYAITWGARPLREAIAAQVHAPLRHRRRSPTSRSRSAAARPRR